MNTKDVDLVPEKASAYRTREYWEWRYNEACGDGKSAYEWVCGYENLREHLNKYIRLFDAAHILGCGNSDFSQKLCKDQPSLAITNCDYSVAVIEDMWHDITQMSLRTNSQNIVIDKCTIDALTCVDPGEDGRGVWDEPAPHILATVDGCLAETHRILTQDGIFISVSFNQPHFRLPLLKRHGLFEFDKPIQVDAFCYLYVGRKRQDKVIAAVGA